MRQTALTPSERYEYFKAKAKRHPRNGRCVRGDDCRHCEGPDDRLLSDDGRCSVCVFKPGQQMSELFLYQIVTERDDDLGGCVIADSSDRAIELWVDYQDADIDEYPGDTVADIWKRYGLIVWRLTPSMSGQFLSEGVLPYRVGQMTRTYGGPVSDESITGDDE